MYCQTLTLCRNSILSENMAMRNNLFFTFDIVINLLLKSGIFASILYPKSPSKDPLSISSSICNAACVYLFPNLARWSFFLRFFGGRRVRGSSLGYRGLEGSFQTLNEGIYRQDSSLQKSEWVCNRQSIEWR